MSNTRFSAASGQPLRIALPLAAMLALLLVGCGGSQSDGDAERRAALIQPVAQVELREEEEAATEEADAPDTVAEAAAEEAVETADAGRSGEEVYKAHCTACHAAGVAGAPKTGDEGDWAPRIEKGLETNIESVINGLGAMPPRGGGGANITDAEIRHAVIYLLNGAGGDF